MKCQNTTEQVFTAIEIIRKHTGNRTPAYNDLLRESRNLKFYMLDANIYDNVTADLKAAGISYTTNGWKLSINAPIEFSMRNVPL